MADEKKCNCGNDASEEQTDLQKYTEEVKALAKGGFDVLSNSAINVVSKLKEIGLEGIKLAGNLEKVQGSFPNNIDSFSSQMDIANSNIEGLITDLGQILLPIATEVVKKFNEVADKVKNALANPEVQASIQGLAKDIGDLVNGALSFFADNLDIITEGLTWVMDNSEVILAGIVAIGAALATIAIIGAISSIVGLFVALYEEIATGTPIMEAFNIVVGMNPFVLIAAAVIGLIAAFIFLWNTSDGFRNFWIGLWDNIKTIFSDVWNGIMTFFTEVIPGWIDSLIQWLSGIPQWFSELPGKIGYFLGYLLAQLLLFGINAWTWVTTEVPNIINTIINWFAQLPSNIYNWLMNVVSNLEQWASNMISKAEQAAKDIVGGIINFFKNLPGEMENIGKNIVTGIYNGIINAKDWILGKIDEFVSGVVQGFKDALGIHSPSRVLRDEVGKFIAKGIAVGFVAEVPKMQGDIDSSMSDMVARMQGAVGCEIAATTANVASNNSAITKDNAINDTLMNSNGKVIENHIHVDIEGREVAKAVAPYQGVFDTYQIGR
ncbi:phage tail protein [Clostridium cellulovorans]|uniref:Uncharacterized protein n=1 Tax=Clostridium cellulovorans (strain ATCC 35296 / DSM 3052 / OCM 3 / 743B) TaxID=573061 RepID=D9SPF6_CLOC7|nr:hypothetical protein [Clostridium cellulovorans]ADL50005.1 hypothetical protein Clocel_0221 [Clostridium cellulovorans 743B]